MKTQTKRKPISPKRLYFSFSYHVKLKAYNRQNYRCATCGENLIKLLRQNEYNPAHHVMPVQSGDMEDPADKWMRTAENCVMLCEDCHHHVGHGGGHYATVAASPREFPYSHTSQAEHQKWANRINEKWRKKRKKLRR